LGNLFILIAKERFEDFRQRFLSWPVQRPAPVERPPAPSLPDALPPNCGAIKRPVPSVARLIRLLPVERRGAPSTVPSAPSGKASGRDKGLSQQQLADLVGTSHSQISGIESGRHRTNLDTLTLIGHALDRRIVLGFESATPSGRAKRELVAF
jgi:DNA-binding XRE family transcriptional regulator